MARSILCTPYVDMLRGACCRLQCSPLDLEMGVFRACSQVGENVVDGHGRIAEDLARREAWKYGRCLPEWSPQERWLSALMLFGYCLTWNGEFWQ